MHQLPDRGTDLGFPKDRARLEDDIGKKKGSKMVDDDVADKLFYHHPHLCCPHGEEVTSRLAGRDNH